MPVEKVPLQTSHNANVAPAAQGAHKTIEEVYQKKTQLEHILLRPDTYIGSVEKHTQNLWVWENDEMVNRSVSYVPGLYKIFDEILVNAADNKQRDPSMNSLKVVIDAAQNLISVYNNGNGVPVEIHQEEKVYVPELIFGHLLTSSNYDDNEKKTTGGRNGYGAKLTNIFSTEFVIETADGSRMKKYKQVFSDNMGKKSDPVIAKGKKGENWTQVSFKPDLAKFSMAYLEEDVVALMKKRVIDMAGCLGKTVKVELNGVRVPVKMFPEYVELYLSSARKSRTIETLEKFFYEDSSKRWEVCVSVSEGQFQQVSFVNGIATIKGGTHVDYVTSQISNYLMAVVNKKNKNANVKAHNVKSHLWVFVNALIDNPAFDSQTKETLTLRQSSFGSKCELPEDFLKKVSKSTILDALLSWANFKQNKDLKKTDGSKTGRIQDCPKLEDANLAGGKDSAKCTLILTEGDSAKALAVAGISVVGRDYYGVFPLRGKLLNVREASPKQLNENKEIINIKKILGLQHGKDYDSVKSLRYGHLMIMTDQDHDGSHIKGLLINFIHAFWPSLLKVPSFMIEFITPIVKATHRSNRTISFYTMPEYEAWKESLGGNASGWSIKYYKGLGTSTAKEGKEYFSELTKHRKDFVWADDEQDSQAIELAFSKKKIEARKNWLRQFEPGTYLDHKDSLITYSDFINKELILFSMADVQRSIPSMLDGLKPGQRKILFCSFKKNLVKEQKVAQFVGYASEHSAYHHGETSLAGTIIGMAQDFVGSNNINFLLPNGQFGTRNQGGKDHASARYIYTCLSPITRFLFPKEDDVLLDYLNEDGQSIEPTWYMPVIPTVLVNGSEGIGTGWSSYIPNYNPRDIIANVKRLLDGEMMVPMDPWYRKFKGTIEKIAVREGVGSYIVNGIIEEINETTVHITELPVRKWTQDYKEFLETLQGTDKTDPFIKGVMEYHTDTRVEFRIVLPEANLMMARQEGLLKKFKLTSSISINNMHLFDSNGVIKKYESPEQILEEFYHKRLEYYVKRRKVSLENLELELLKLDNKVRFILGVVSGEIVVNNRKRMELVLELQRKGFTPFPKKISVEAVVVGSTEDTEEQDEDNIPSNGVRVSDYEYLLSLAISTLTLEKVQELCANKDKLSEEVEEMRRSTPEYLWRKDLDALEKALDEQDARDALADKESVSKMKERGDAANKFSKLVAPKNPRKNTKKPIIKGETMETSTSAMETENVTEVVVKPKGRAAPRKAPAKKDKPLVLRDEEEDDDDEVMELKDRLAAYNLDGSPDQSAAMETEVAEGPAKKKAPAKRTAAAQKKVSATIKELSDDDENNANGESDFEVEVVAAAKKGGRKPAAAKPAAPRKRGPTKKQQLLTDMMKPAEAAAVASPEKKVRKMRASPFNKKSSSILGRVGNDKEDGAPSGSQENSGSASTPGSGDLSDFVPAAGRRPRRANVRQVQYITSDSEGEATNDSDFSEEEDEDDE